ncbi:hypothetical protein CRUP_037849 [Coryphaenoides rupestris]|nr:hypothetical protein CRUP_037849 [Coryphaenoides rupestris]
MTVFSLDEYLSPVRVLPVNFLDHTQHKGLAVAVFGVLFCKLCGLVVSPNPLPFATDPENKRALNAASKLLLLLLLLLLVVMVLLLVLLLVVMVLLLVVVVMRTEDSAT